VKAGLPAGGTTLDNVFKVTIFLADMDYFAEMNGDYAKHLTGENKPARSCIAVKTLPKHARVEIECIAQG
jgi:2-iminobutanoate/2-iminopropanoate deaminase